MIYYASNYKLRRNWMYPERTWADSFVMVGTVVICVAWAFFIMAPVFI